MLSLPKDFLSVMRGAEYVFCGESAITLVSSGRALEIRANIGSGDNEKKPATLLLVDPVTESNVTELMSGTPQSVARAYTEIERRLSRPIGRSRLSLVSMLLVSVASVAVIAGTVFTHLEARRFAEEMHSSDAARELDQVIPGLLPKQEQTNEVVPAMTAPIGPASELSTLKVLKTPEFLKTGVAGPAAPVGGETSPVAPTSTAVPAPYNTPLWVDTPASAQSSRPKTTEDAKEKTSQKDGATTTFDADAKPTQSPKQPEVPQPPEKSTSAAPVRTETKASKDEPVDHASIKKDAEAAVKNMIGGGMTEQDVRKLLLNLQALNAGGEQQMTPEMLRALPEEIAAMFAGKDMGMELDGPGSGTMNILPSEVVDRFRGKDGVATIPENYSWYARTGGPVSIPLPGGGDIKHPDDIKDFGLQP